MMRSVVASSCCAAGWTTEDNDVDRMCVNAQCSTGGCEMCMTGKLSPRSAHRIHSAVLQNCAAALKESGSRIEYSTFPQPLLLLLI